MTTLRHWFKQRVIASAWIRCLAIENSCLLLLMENISRIRASRIGQVFHLVTSDDLIWLHSLLSISLYSYNEPYQWKDLKDHANAACIKLWKWNRSRIRFFLYHKLTKISQAIFHKCFFTFDINKVEIVILFVVSNKKYHSRTYLEIQSDYLTAHES